MIGVRISHYRKIASLTDYILVSQNKPSVEHFVKQPDGHWLLFDAEGLEAKTSWHPSAVNSPSLKFMTRSTSAPRKPTMGLNLRCGK